VISTRRIRFEDGYYIPHPRLKVTTMQNKEFLIGALEEGEIDAIFIGKAAEFNGDMGKNLWLDTKGAHVVYIMGKRRSGKSHTLGNIVEGLINDTFHIGTLKQAVLIFDTLNIFWTMDKPSVDQLDELERWDLKPEQVQRMAVYYPRGMGHSYYPKSYKEFSVRPCDLDGTDWASLFEWDPLLDPMGQCIREVYQRIAVEGYYDGVKRIDAKSDYSIDDMIQCIRGGQLNFRRETLDAVERRLAATKSLSIFSSQGTSAHDLFKVGQATVLLLRDLDPQVRGLVLGLLVKKIIQLRGITTECEKRAEIKIQEAKKLNSHERTRLELEAKQLEAKAKSGLPRGWILIDEAHNYIPNTGIIGSKAPLKQYINEGRNIGLSIAATTQQPSGLDAAIRRNADVLIVHSITMTSDIEVVSNMLNTTVPDEVEIGHEHIESRTFEYMVRELPLGFALIDCQNANRVFLAKIRPRASAHGGREF